MNTEGRRKEGTSQRGQEPEGRDGLLLCPILTPSCLPNPLPLEEVDTDVHRQREIHTERQGDTDTEKRKRDTQRKETEMRETGRERQRNEVGEKLLTREYWPLALHLSLKKIVVLSAIPSLPSPFKGYPLGHRGSLHCGDVEPRRQGRAGMEERRYRG